MSDLATLKNYGKALGRPGLSERVIELITAFDGSYKGAIILCGQLQAIAKACEFDSYWSEKVSIGFNRELDKAFKKTGQFI